MKKMWLVTSFVVVTASSPVYALHHEITPLPPSDVTCDNLKGTWQFKANWQPLFDATKPPDPVTKKRPFLLDSKGKPWPTYQVSVKNTAGSERGAMQCTIPSGGAVNCGGATICNILVTCPIGASGALVAVQGTGVVSSSVRTNSGIRPANCRTK